MIRRFAIAVAISAAALVLAPTIASAHGETILVTPTTGPITTQITVTFTSNDPKVCDRDDQVFLFWDYQVALVHPDVLDINLQGIALSRTDTGCTATGQFVPYPNPSPRPGSFQPSGHVVGAIAAKGLITDKTNSEFANTLFVERKGNGQLDLPPGVVQVSPIVPDDISHESLPQPAVTETAPPKYQGFLALGVIALGILVAAGAAIAARVSTIRRRRAEATAAEDGAED